jgi:hypothetical protein
MSPITIDSIKPLIAKLLAPVVTALVAWLANKFGVALPTDAAGNLTEYGAVVGATAFITLYGIIDKLIAKLFNPGDAASGHIVGQQQTQNDHLKATARRAHH